MYADTTYTVLTKCLCRIIKITCTKYAVPQKWLVYKCGGLLLKIFDRRPKHRSGYLHSVTSFQYLYFSKVSFNFVPTHQICFQVTFSSELFLGRFGAKGSPSMNKEQRI